MAGADRDGGAEAADGLGGRGVRRAAIATLEEGSNIVEGLRRIKSPAELASMRRAGEITARALRATIDATARA